MKHVVVMMLAVAASSGVAVADPGKDEGGKGRERAARELRLDRDGARGREDWGKGPRRAAREFKEEYDDGRCRVERKLERSGEYKEEIKCRPRRS